MKQNQKSPGRPTKYETVTTITPSQFKAACELGATEEQLSAIFGVSCKTINNWQVRYPEFLQALKEGREKADGVVIASLFKRACGFSSDDGKHYPPDTTACIFWLKNRRPDQCRDVQRSELTRANGQPFMDNTDKAALAAAVAAEIVKHRNVSE